MKLNDFPDDFIFGTATSSYQIEGAAYEDGRGLSTWDVFCKEPGRIDNDDNGDTACDHYHRYESDIALMKEIGVDAYRFSFAWPRILPEGEGSVNRKGIDFYNRLIDKLLEQNIVPFPTLFHWDLPNALQLKYGGWKSKETSKRFADFAELCTKEFGDRLDSIITINEIMCFTWLAHEENTFAPGGKEGLKTTYQTMHNAILGHGLALKAIRQVKPSMKVGIVDNSLAAAPLWQTDENIDAARKAFLNRNRSTLLPLFGIPYAPEYFKDNMPECSPEEMNIIAEPIDFFGLNYYHADFAEPDDSEPGYRLHTVPEGFSRTDMGWPVTPRGLYWTLKFLNELRNNIPIYITENGMAAKDEADENGFVNDLDRLDYFRTHLTAVKDAIEDGVNVKGYFAWSLMDNFEWPQGYAKRFGIVRVDYETQKRTVKKSGRYYAEVIRNRKIL